MLQRCSVCSVAMLFEVYKHCKHCQHCKHLDKFADMKTLLLALLTTIILLPACVKNDNECAATEPQITVPASERTALINYLNSRGIVATEHSSGLFYVVETPGSGASINNLCAQLSVGYKGQLTNDKVFDSTATGVTIPLQLTSVIPGWQKGVPIIREGGIITLYIPPSLGYGNREIRDPQTNAIVIPANSILIFRIRLVAVQNL
jgi:FKBP-type peptidyl-prolyl cis-trans isomerase FkpA